MAGICLAFCRYFPDAVCADIVVAMLSAESLRAAEAETLTSMPGCNIFALAAVPLIVISVVEIIL